jgi:hypothetical protein
VLIATGAAAAAAGALPKASSKKARWAALRAASAGLAATLGWTVGVSDGRIGFTGGPAKGG